MERALRHHLSSLPGRLGRGVVRAALPAVCPVTRTLVQTPGTIAPAAWRELSLIAAAPRCERCGRPMPGAPRPEPGGPLVICEPCHAAQHPWERGAAAMLYDGTGRDIILSLKHADRLDFVPLIAGWMARAGAELIERADLILPVPLHWRRLWSRRYNQSAELARRIARDAGKPRAFAPGLVRRPAATPSQGGLDREARIANLAGAFALASGAERWVVGARLLLIDDVFTTGATLAEMTRVVQGAGAQQVDILVAALVPAGPYAYVDLGEANEMEDRDADG